MHESDIRFAYSVMLALKRVLFLVYFCTSDGSALNIFV